MRVLGVMSHKAAYAIETVKGGWQAHSVPTQHNPHRWALLFFTIYGSCAVCPLRALFIPPLKIG